MKKLILLSVFSIISIIGFSQLTVVNNTGSDIMVGVQAGSNPAVCSWVTITSGTLITASSSLTIPLGGLAVYRVGAYQVTMPSNSGHDVAPCWNPICYNSSGAYTFTWGGTGCNKLVIN